MNDARHQRRMNTILPSMFYELKARHHQRDLVEVPSGYDVKRLRKLADEEQATFVELRDVICWLWLHPFADHWRGELSDIGGFCNAYRTLCDRFDACIPHWFDNTTPRSKAVAAGSSGGRPSVVNEDAIQAAGLALADLPELPPRKDITE